MFVEIEYDDVSTKRAVINTMQIVEIAQSLYPPPDNGGMVVRMTNGSAYRIDREEYAHLASFLRVMRT